MADASQPLVSTIIPTYNRAHEVTLAIDSALAQTYPAQEIVVVDDGSTDGTDEVLRARYGSKVRILCKPNGGVSSARNYGMKHARGERLAFLDSDDEWHPEHLAAQVAFLAAHPTYGMVLTDVQRMDADRADTDYLRRRDMIPVDGDVLSFVVRNPTLAPASAMITRAVFETVGGFDTDLRTAEDLDFHMRIAARFPIGVIERPLTRCMRGHEGLSALDAQTEDDYIRVVERFVASHAADLDERDRKAALFNAYTRNARGYLWAGDFRNLARLSAKSVGCITEPAQARQLAELGVLVMRNLASRARRALGIPR